MSIVLQIIIWTQRNGSDFEIMQAFSRRDFLPLRNTAVYAIFSVIPLVIIGFVAAMVVKRQTRAMFAARALLMFPYVSSMVAVSMVWLYLLEPTNGILNKLLGAMGIPGKKWLFDENLALPCLIVVNIWKNIGYVMHHFSCRVGSNTQGTGTRPVVWIARATFECCSLSTTIPCVRPVTVFVVTTMCIEAFKTFDQVKHHDKWGTLELHDYSRASNLCPGLYRVPDRATHRQCR